MDGQIFEKPDIPLWKQGIQFRKQGTPLRKPGSGYLFPATGNDQFLTILDWNSKSMASLEISPSFDIRCKNKSQYL